MGLEKRKEDSWQQMRTSLGKEDTKFRRDFRKLYRVVWDVTFLCSQDLAMKKASLGILVRKGIHLGF